MFTFVWLVEETFTYWGETDTSVIAVSATAEKGEAIIREQAARDGLHITKPSPDEHYWSAINKRGDRGFYSIRQIQVES